MAPTAAWAQGASASAADSANGDTRGRFFHASKCVMSFGFGGGCDKDAAAPKREDRAVETKASVDTSTRGQFFHASKCVVSLGFVGGCNKDAPAGSPSVASRPADAAPAAPDTSTRGQFLHATKCLTTMGFGSGCNKP